MFARTSGIIGHIFRTNIYKLKIDLIRWYDSLINPGRREQSYSLKTKKRNWTTSKWNFMQLLWTGMKITPPHHDSTSQSQTFFSLYSSHFAHVTGYTFALSLKTLKPINYYPSALLTLKYILAEFIYII